MDISQTNRLVDSQFVEKLHLLTNLSYNDTKRNYTNVNVHILWILYSVRLQCAESYPKCRQRVGLQL